MTALALVLVLTSALLHASWNLLAKRISGARVIVWMFTSLSSVFLVPVAITLLILDEPRFGVLGVAFILGTTLLHLIYFTLLQRGYRTGDLSLVYPLARGLGPTLASIGAIVLLGERPSWLVIVGLILVVGGIILLTLRVSDGAPRHPREAIRYGILIGLCIAAYTVWDKHAVSGLGVPPLVLEAAAGAGIALMLTPHAIRHWADVKATWRDHRPEVIGIAVMAPMSYILILTVMKFTPLTYVAPAREIGILFAALMGTRLLGERDAGRRLLAAALVVAGVIVLAIG